MTIERTGMHRVPGHEDLERAFLELKAVALSANRYFFNGGEEYSGPVSPSGISLMVNHAKNTTHYWLILAEQVPLRYTLGSAADGSEPYPTGVVLVALDENLQFAQCDPGAKTLGGLASNFWCSDGTAETWEGSTKNFTKKILYRTQPF